MARTITDEEIKLSIIINGNPAQKQLGDLEKATRGLTEEKKALQIELKRVENALGKDSEEYKKLKASITQTTNSIDNNKAAMKQLQETIGLTGLTIAQLQNKASQLKLTLRNLIPGSADYIKYETELKEVSNRLGEISGKAQTAKMSLSGIADSFNKYAALGASVIATLTGVVFSIQKMIDINGKLSDAQADVMKTTNMSKKEVDELGKSFGLLETRTSRIDLYKIAEEGGRLGIPKAELQDFVKSMNMAAVSLGDSFTGGVEEVASKLGKLKFLFKETKDLNVDQAYASIGSAINDLGAYGVATESNIAEFATRLGSLPDLMKPTVQQTLALGAAFEESGVEAEISSRAYGIVLKEASDKSDKFAKVMRLSKQEVENLINTNPMEFMLQFAEGMKGMSGTDTAKTLNYLGIAANGAEKAIGAMGNNTARFRELIDVSNNSFSAGTSLIQEYNIKNNDLAATLEKISKRISGLFSSEDFINWLGNAVNWFAKFIGATRDADGSVAKWRETIVFTIKVIGVLTAALITNIAWQKLVALWTTRNTEANLLYSIGAKARAFADGVAMIASQAYAAVTMLLTGNIVGATQAFRVMTSAMMTTPWGFILAGIAAIVVAYQLFSSEAKKAATSQSLMIENQKQVDGIVKDQTASLMTLISVAKDAHATEQARNEALKKAIEIAPDYLKGLTLQNLETINGTNILNGYINSLEKKAMLEVLQERQHAILEDMAKRKSKSLEEEVSWYDELYAQVTNLNNSSQAGVDIVITASQRKQKALKDLQNELNLTNAEMKKFLEKNPNLIKTIDSKSDYLVPDDKADKKEKKNPNSSNEELNKLNLENELKYADEVLKNERQLEDNRITILMDGTNKELAIEKLRHERRIEDLEKQKVHLDQIAKLEEEASKAKKDGDIKKYNALTRIKESWIGKNKNLDNQINQIEEQELAIHNLKLKTIYENAEKKRIENFQKEFEHQKLLRETAFNEQLAALGTNEKAKQALTDKFNKEELDFSEDHIKKQISILKADLALNDIFNLFDVKKRKEIKEQIDFLLNALSKIDAAKSGKKDKTKFDGAFLSAFGETDVLGFTTKQWKDTYENLKTLEGKLQAVNMVVGGMQNLWKTYSDFQSASENRNLTLFQQASDKKKARLQRQLQVGYISQAEYDHKIAKLDKETAKRKAEAEYAQAKRSKQMAIVGAIISTAQAVINAANTQPFFPLGLAMMSVAGIAGALQIATIAKQPLPDKTAGYEQGLYRDEVIRQQDGKRFNVNQRLPMQSGLFSKPTVLVGEGPGDMPEMVIDKKSYSQISPATKNALLNELRGIKGFEQGYYNQSQMRIEVPATTTTASNNSTDELLKMNTAVMSETLQVLKDLRDNGVEGKFYKGDLKSAKNIKDAISDYDTFRNRNKF